MPPTPASTVGSSIPELWSTELQRALEKSLRYANLANRKYEGLIREKGDTVRIQTVADVTIGNYARNTDITLQTLTTTDLDLVVDQARTYGFFWDRLDQTQTATPGIMQEAARRAAYNMRDEIDQYVAGLLDDGVSTAPDNILDPVTVGMGGGDADAFEVLVDLATTLEANNVPEGDRWVVVPPWYAGMLKKDPRRSSFGTVTNIEQYEGGLLGIDAVSGLRVWVSNNVPVDMSDGYSIIAGYPDAITFAEQLTDFKIVENPLRFGDNCLGVMVYGGKVTRPYALAKVVATQAS